MFGNSYFGEFAFGNSPDYTPSESERILLSSNFIPEVLADEPVFTQLTDLVDYITNKYHIEEIKGMAGLYDTFHPNFNADQIIEFMGGSGHIVAPLNDSQKRSLVLLLSSLYEVKGLRSGIEALMSSFGIPGYLFEEWEVNAEAETGIPSRPDIFPFQIWYEKIEKCNVAVVFNVTGKLAIEGLEDNLIQSIEALLWVCARLQNYTWLMDFRGDEWGDVAPSHSDSIEFYDYFEFCTKFFREGNIWCFLPKPILESTETDPLDRKLMMFSVDEYDIPYWIEDEYGNTIIYNEDYSVVTEENDGYDGTYFQNEYGDFSLEFWKMRPEQEIDCCEDAQEIVLFGDDSIYTEFYDIYFSAEYASGLKTLYKTYIEINSFEDLMKIGNDIEYPLDANYRLTADIDFSGEDFEPIGSMVFDTIVGNPIWDECRVFTGTFDGDGHSISNMTLDLEDDSYIGLFRSIQSGSIIKNLIITDASVNGYTNVGILSGYSEGASIKNVRIEGTIEYASKSGGISGYLAKSNCFQVESRCIIQKNTDLSSNGNSSGVFAGVVYNSTINKCISFGEIIGRNNVGGFLGTAVSSYINQCSSYVETVEGNNYVGGFIGTNNNGSIIVDCYSLSAVDGNSYVGGFAGVNKENSGGSSLADAEIETCYSGKGAITGSSNVGGFCGDNETSAIITDCFWDTDTSGQGSSDGGTGLTTSEMLDPYTNMLNFDFIDTWYAEVGFRYPRLTTVIPPDPENDYILIDSLTKLALIGNDPGYPLDGKYYLNDDLDISDCQSMDGGNGWTPIGYDPTLVNVFSGIFDGRGHTISGLYINRDDVIIQGLFGGNSGLIANLTVTGSVTVGSSAGNVAVYEGGLIGGNSGVISYCVSEVDVSLSGDGAVVKGSGGVCGINTAGGLIQMCESRNNSVYGNSEAGGLIGFSEDSSILLCISSSSVSAIDSAGGLIGLMDGGDVSLSFSYGEVFANTNAGGLIGVLGDPISIVNSYWDKDTSGQSTSASGIGHTTEEMMQESTYLLYPFSYKMDIINGETYPYFNDYNWYDSVTPYIEISSREELELIGMHEHYPLNGYYILTSNIDLSDSAWTPIGDTAPDPVSIDFVQNGNYFTGVFDGNGYKIYGLTVDGGATDNCCGLFNVVGRGGFVINLDITTNSSSGEVGSVVGDEYCGIICGILFNASIVSCTVRGSVDSLSFPSGGVCGGVSGGTLIECRSYASVYGQGVSGGLIGAINYIYSNNDSCIKRCLSEGNIVEMTQNYVGGLIGVIVGSSLDTSCITNCYANTEVSGNDYVGGLIGSITGYYVTNCYSSSIISGSDYVGGLIGENSTVTPAEITGCFWDKEISGITVSDGGVGKDTAEMKVLSTFDDSDWDFTDVWRISDGTSYPDLLFSIKDTLFYRSETMSWLENDEDGKVYVFGGDSSGRLFSDVWRTAHGGRLWVEELSNSDWSVRKNHSSFIYNDRIFIFGGIINDTVLNDMWEMVEDDYGNLSFVKIFDETTVTSIDLEELNLGQYRAIVYNSYIYFMGSESESPTIYRMYLNGGDNPIFEAIEIPEKFGIGEINAYPRSISFVFNNLLYLINGISTGSNTIYFDGTNWSKKSVNTCSGSQPTGIKYINVVPFDDFVCILTNTGLFVSQDCCFWGSVTTFSYNGEDSEFGTGLLAGSLSDHLYYIDNVGVFRRGLYLDPTLSSYTWDHSLIETDEILVSSIEEECIFALPESYTNGTQVKIIGITNDIEEETDTVFYMSFTPDEYLEYEEYPEYSGEYLIGLSLSYNDAMSYNIINKTELLSEIGNGFDSIRLTWTEVLPQDRENLN